MRQRKINISNNNWAYIIISVFIITNALLIYHEFFYMGMLSVGLLIFVLALYRLDSMFYLIVLLTPVSIPLRELIYGVENDIILPTEPLIILVMLIFFIKLVHERKYDRKIAYHPVSVAIYLNLIWILITSVTSTMPVVSFKFLLSRVWFLVAFYFLAAMIFKKYKNIESFLWCYVLPFVIIIIYSIVRHTRYGFSDQQAAHIVSTPFFNDHTAYGAVLALTYPVIIYFLIQPDKNLLYRVATFLLFSLFSLAIVLSYTRATWISLLGAVGVIILVKYKVKLRFLILIASVIFIYLFISWQDILIKLERNKTDSSKYLLEHVKSISNVSTDASNLERINRWSCALRMFKEKPLLGWGPGTYMFQYAPFQRSYQVTVISTNTGLLGNAHSEYIGPLAESGIPGSLTFILIIIFTIITAIRAYNKSKDVKAKKLILALLAGLVSYYIHGMLNNFLDTDKASCLFWGFTAIFVVLDVYQANEANS